MLFTINNVEGQIFENSIIKTRPFQDFVGFNPNLGLEKSISKKFSLEIEYMYRNRTWYSNGGEWNFGKFHQSDGFRILGGVRKYMGRNKTYPYAWFLGLQLTYSQIRFNNIKQNDFHNEYEKTINLLTKYSEIIINIGRQFQIFKRLTIEFYIGPSLYLFYSKTSEITYSTDPNEIGNIENTKYPFGEYGRFNFGWTIGYKFK